MSNLHTIITTLSKEDKKVFVRNLKERNKRNDTKNVELRQLQNSY